MTPYRWEILQCTVYAQAYASALAFYSGRADSAAVAARKAVSQFTTDMERFSPDYVEPPKEVADEA